MVCDVKNHASPRSVELLIFSGSDPRGTLALVASTTVFNRPSGCSRGKTYVHIKKNKYIHVYIISFQT